MTEVRHNVVMPMPRISSEQGRLMLIQVHRMRANGLEPDRDQLALAVRFVLQELARVAPGNSVEVRVPPFGVVQCVEGPRHTRGTPPNVVEMDSMVLLKLESGELEWGAGLASGAIRASGIRADLDGYFPLGVGAQ